MTFDPDEIVTLHGQGTMTLRTEVEREPRSLRLRALRHTKKRQGQWRSSPLKVGMKARLISTIPSKTQQLPNDYIVTIAAFLCKRLCGTRGSLQDKKLA
jgi:hypothetical protein